MNWKKLYLEKVDEIMYLRQIIEQMKEAIVFPTEGEE